MFVLSNFLAAVARILYRLLDLYMWVIIISAVLSWFSLDPYNPIIRLLYQITEPVLRPIRRVIYQIIPMRGMGIDISPIVAIVIIWFLMEFPVKSLLDFALLLR